MTNFIYYEIQLSNNLICVQRKFNESSTKVMLENSLFSNPVGRSKDLGGGVEVWFRHFQSLRLGWKPFPNVDSTQRAFMKSRKVHEIMADMFNTRPGTRLDY